MKRNSYQDIDFADSEPKSLFYDFELGVLNVKITLWNAIVISIQFSGVKFFSDRGWFDSTALIEVNESKLLKEVVQYNYEEGHEPYHLYKHFQFIDGDDEPRLEIICKSVEAYECEI